MIAMNEAINCQFSFANSYTNVEVAMSFLEACYEIKLNEDDRMKQLLVDFPFIFWFQPRFETKKRYFDIKHYICIAAMLE